MEHNARPAYLCKEDADVYQVWRDVRNTTYAGGVVGDGVTDDSLAIQAAIDYATEGVLWSRTGTAAQSTVPAFVYIPGGTYLIKNSLQLYVNTVIVGDPLNMPKLIADPSLGYNAVIYMYDAGFSRGATTQFYQGVRNLEFDTTRVPNNVSGNGVNAPSSQACFLQNCKFTMTPDSNHIGVQMYGPGDTGGSGLLVGDLSFYGGATGLRLNNQQYNLKNMTFDSVTTAIEVHHAFTATLQDMTFKNCGLGIDTTEANVAGSISIIDSSCSDTATFLQANASFSFVIENFNNSNPEGILLYNTSSGATVLTGSIEPGYAWLYGPAFGSSSNSTYNATSNGISSSGMHRTYNSTSKSTGSNAEANVKGLIVKSGRSPSLLDANGKWFTKAQPQYEELPASDFSNVKSDFGCVGDGKTDDTEALQRALRANAASGKVTFVPQGTYMISSTVYVPPNSRIAGEVWSTFNAIGSYFSDESSPQPMLKVGNPGETGIAHFTDVAFSVGGVLPGAILVEVNLAGKEKGDVGFWNSHFRVGGWVGAGDIRRKCQADSTAGCKAVFLMLHLTQTSSVYIENMWGWTADHDLDGGPIMNIASGRGVLVEAVKGTWFVGTGFEHNTLYQYQFANARNVFVGMQQTESPYWQGPGSPNLTPDPWISNKDYYDPAFQDCTDGSLIVPENFNSSLGNATTIEGWCRMGYALRIFESDPSSSGSSNSSITNGGIHVYNSAFWVFFNHLVSVPGIAQWRCGSVEGPVENLYWYNIDTRACEYVVYDGGLSEVTQDIAPGSWGAAVAAYLVHSDAELMGIRDGLNSTGHGWSRTRSSDV